MKKKVPKKMNIIVKHFLISGILALLIIQAGPASFAEERGISVRANLEKGSGKTIGDYRALIIGINDYKDDEISDLKTAVNDAKELAEVLEKNYDFKEITLLLDSNANESRIVTELRRLMQMSHENDSVLIYYAGHGELEEETGSGWWIPYNATGGDPSTYLDNSVIQKYIKAIPARHVLVVADSCFSGSLFGDSRALPPIIDDKWYSTLYKKRSRWGMTSGNLTPVADGGSEGHSVFAYQFIDALKENQQPYLTPREIYNNIGPVIRNNSEQMPITKPIKNARDQGGEFIFIRKASLASTPPAKQEAPSNKAATADDRPETAAWKLIENSIYIEDIQDFLNEFPDGIYASVAKMKLKQLQRNTNRSEKEKRTKTEEARNEEQRLKLQREEGARREEERLRLQIELEQKKIELKEKRETDTSGSSEGGFDPSSDNPYGEDY